MKKVLIVVGLIALIVAVELVLRLGEDSAPPQPPAEAPAPVPARPEPPPTTPATPIAPEPAPAPPAAPAVEAGEAVIDVTSPVRIALDPDECRRFAKQFVEKGGTGYTAEDVAYINAQKDMGLKRNLAHMATEYISCKAVERQDFLSCIENRTLLPPNPTLPCEQVFSIFVVLRAHFVLRMRPEQVGDLYTDLPRNVTEWMVAFMQVLADQDPKACDRLSVDPLILGACRIATGAVDTPAGDDPLLDAYYIIMALRTGQIAYLNKTRPGAPVELVHVLLGEKEVCEAAYIERMNTFCDP